MIKIPFKFSRKHFQLIPINIEILIYFLHFYGFILRYGYTLLLVLLAYKVVLYFIKIFCYPELFTLTKSNQLPTFSLEYIFNNNSSYSYRELSTNDRRNNQSPINIITRNTNVIKVSKPLKWNGYSTQPMAMIMNNDGITVSIRGFWSKELKPYIEGGFLNNRYYFHSIIFHWKSFHNDGSEHSFDNVKYPLEMQVIHVKENFKSLSEAMRFKNNNNITIISYIFQIKKQTNALLEPILINLSRVEKTCSKVYIPPIHLDSVLPLFESKYYSYKGSLTQPPYCEIVTWIIYPEPVGISSSQMAKFCNLHSINGLTIRNSRSIQSLNDRNVLFIENN